MRLITFIINLFIKKTEDLKPRVVESSNFDAPYIDNDEIYVIHNDVLMPMDQAVELISKKF